MKKGYVILEIGWEYNDEYYHTGHNGDKYEAPNEVFMDKTKAEEVLNKKEIESFRGNELSGYCSDGIEYILNRQTTIGQLIEYVKENFDVTVSEDDYYDFNIPKKATDKQIKGLLELITIRFYTLHEITINE